MELWLQLAVPGGGVLALLARAVRVKRYHPARQEMSAVVANAIGYWNARYVAIA